MRRTITRIGAVGAGAVLALGLLGAGSPAGADSGQGRKAGKVEKVDRAPCLTTVGHVQGRSQSDPDGMSNGGADKPGCAGGFDDDRDGNNGCGNDADREDDNNGRCGKGERPDRTTPGTDFPSDGDGDDVTGCDVDGRDPEATDTGGCPDTDTDTGTDTDTDTGTRVDGTDTTVQAASAGIGTLAADTQAGPPASTATDVAATGTVATDTTPDSAAAAAGGVPTEVLGQTLERGPGVLARTGAGLGGLALLGGVLCGGGRIALLARRFLRID